MPLVSDIDLTREPLVTTRCATGARPKTLDHLRYSLGHLKSWRISVGGDADISTLSRFEALACLRHVQGGYSAGGVPSRLKALRSFCNWCSPTESHRTGRRPRYG